MSITLRHIAARLGVSVATVSRALREDPRVRPETARRVLAAVAATGYQPDPVVSAGMAKIRRRDFYRETLAWCGDCPRGEQPWLAPLFRAVEDYGARLGYGVEYYHFERPTPRALARLASIWRARGIRGVLLGPLRAGHAELPFPWDGLAWVTIGHVLESPVLHSVERDYAADIATGLVWLKRRGCRRPCFLLDPGVAHLFRKPLVQASLLHYHRASPRPREPYHELDPSAPEAFLAWFKANRPDGVVLPRSLSPALERMTRPLAGLPRVFLSTPERSDPQTDLHFTARFEVIGQVSVNLLHRLLGNREFGVPAYKQTVALSSLRSGEDEVI